MRRISDATAAAVALSTVAVLASVESAAVSSPWVKPAVAAGGSWGAPVPAADERKVRLPARLTTIDGGSLDLVTLAAASTLVVVTLKSPSCPVCQQQLARLQEHGAELRDCGVTFVVLAPGPREELAGIQQRTGFPYPFVEDVGLELAESLGLRMSAAEIVPAFLLVEPDLTVSWTRLGRSGANFGDAALLEKLRCAGKLTI